MRTSGLRSSCHLIIPRHSVKAKIANAISARVTAVRTIRRRWCSGSWVMAVGSPVGNSGSENRSRCFSPYLTRGGVAKLWYGGGDGRVHSRPSAPSHTWLVAFLPPLAD